MAFMSGAAKRGGTRRIHAVDQPREGEPGSRVGITKPTRAKRKQNRRKS